MSRNGSGTYNLPAGNPVVTGNTISSSWANTTLSDIASALTGSIAADGQTTPTANLVMGTYAHTGVGNATARTMYASAGQVQDSVLTYLTSVAGTNAITASAPIVMTAYATGQVFRFIAAGASTGAVTININSIGLKSVVRTDGTALVSGDIASGAAVQIMYDGTNFQLLSDANGKSETVTNLTVTGTLTGNDITTTGNTILGNASTDTLNVGNGGLIKDASGNLGLGVTPSAWSSATAMQIGAKSALYYAGSNTNLGDNVYFNGASRYITTAAATVYSQSNGSHIWERAASGTAGNPITFTTAMTLDASSNLAIQRAGEVYFVAQNTANNVYGYFDANASGISIIARDNGAGGKPLSFVTGTTTAMTLDASGNLLINRTSAGTDVAKLSITAASAGQNGLFIDGWGSGICNGAIFRTAVSASSTCIEFKYLSSVIGGIFTTSSATSYVTSSDYRLKENIAPMTDALSTVAKLKPVTYKWKADGFDGQGFIAHELAEVVPDCVTGEKDATKEEEYEISPAIPAVLDEEGNEVTPAVEAVIGTRTVPVYQGIDTSFLVATLTAAIQEQQAMIDELKSKVAALEAK